MKKESLLKDYLDGLKIDLEYKTIASIASIDEETGLTRADLFNALDKEGFNYKKPFDLYTNKYGRFEEVPDDCIFCDSFYIEEKDYSIEV